MSNVIFVGAYLGGKRKTFLLILVRMTSQITKHFGRQSNVYLQIRYKLHLLKTTTIEKNVVSGEGQKQLFSEKKISEDQAVAEVSTSFL